MAQLITPELKTLLTISSSSVAGVTATIPEAFDLEQEHRVEDESQSSSSNQQKNDDDGENNNDGSDYVGVYNSNNVGIEAAAAADKYKRNTKRRLLGFRTVLENITERIIMSNSNNSYGSSNNSYSSISSLLLIEVSEALSDILSLIGLYFTIWIRFACNRIPLEQLISTVITEGELISLIKSYYYFPHHNKNNNNNRSSLLSPSFDKLKLPRVGDCFVFWKDFYNKEIQTLKVRKNNFFHHFIFLFCLLLSVFVV